MKTIVLLGDMDQDHQKAEKIFEQIQIDITGGWFHGTNPFVVLLIIWSHRVSIFYGQTEIYQIPVSGVFFKKLDFSFFSKISYVIFRDFYMSVLTGAAIDIHSGAAPKKDTIFRTE